MQCPVFDIPVTRFAVPPRFENILSLILVIAYITEYTPEDYYTVIGNNTMTKVDQAMAFLSRTIRKPPFYYIFSLVLPEYCCRRSECAICFGRFWNRSMHSNPSCIYFGNAYPRKYHDNRGLSIPILRI